MGFLCGGLIIETLLARYLNCLNRVPHTLPLPPNSHKPGPPRRNVAALEKNIPGKTPPHTSFRLECLQANPQFKSMNTKDIRTAKAPPYTPMWIAKHP